METPCSPCQAAKPWQNPMLQTKIGCVCGMSSLPDILWTGITWYASPLIRDSVLVDWVTEFILSQVCPLFL